MTTAIQDKFQEFLEFWEFDWDSSPDLGDVAAKAIINKICGFAIFSGDISMINFFEEQKVFNLTNIEDDLLICAIASSSDDAFHRFFLNCERKITERQNHFCQIAAEENQFERLKFLYNAGYKLHGCGVFISAVVRENLPMIEWLIRQRCPLDLNSVFEIAANNCNLELLNFLYSELPKTEYEKWDVKFTLRHVTRDDKHKPAVEWLESKLADKSSTPCPRAVVVMEDSSSSSSDGEEEKSSSSEEIIPDLQGADRVDKKTASATTTGGGSSRVSELKSLLTRLLCVLSSTAEEEEN